MKRLASIVILLLMAMLLSLGPVAWADEVTVVQYPDSNYEPGPGWPEGWSPPEVPEGMPQRWVDYFESIKQWYPQYTRLERRVLSPLPNWTQEYPYLWESEAVGCGNTLYIYWYPTPDQRLIIEYTGRNFGAEKLSSSSCQFEPVQYITEARKASEEEMAAISRVIELEMAIDAGHPGMTRGFGGGFDGSPEEVYLFLDYGDASRKLDVPAYLDTQVSRVRVPIRFISEFMGAQVDWDDATQQVSIRFPAITREVLKAVPAPGHTYESMYEPYRYLPNGAWFHLESQTVSTPARSIILTVGEPWAVVDGERVPLDAPPVVKQGRTMVPIRFVAEQMGAKVYWVGDQPIFKDSGGELTGTYQVHIFTPFFPLYEYPSWYLEQFAVKQ